MQEENFENEYNEDSITDAISGLINDDYSINNQEEEIDEEPQEEVVASEEVEYDPALNVPSDYKVKVKINGIEQEVTLDELRNGYQRQADYTQKTQELASQRSELSSKEQEYNQYLNSIPMLAQVATQNITEAQSKLYSPEFIALAETDPAHYVSEKAKLEGIINQNYQAQQQMKVQYEQYQDNWNKQRQAEYDLQLQEAHQVLSRDIEGWATGSVIEDIRNFANKSGFQSNELEGLIDPRQVKILHKAMLYDNLMNQQDIASKKVKAVPGSSLKPGNNPVPSQQDEFKTKMRQVVSTNNDRDIADFMSKFL
jgi:hypothetical protein